MSYPPPPGGPPHQPPQGGVPGQPPPSGPPYQPPPGGMPGQYGPLPQQPPWPQQQPWSPGPPPKKRGNGWKWAVGAVALLVVIGVTAAVTISVVRDDDSGNPTPSGDTYGLASAADTGPANIITEDPSCSAWSPISQSFVDVQRKGWNKRDPAIPAADWTPEQRAQYEEVGQAAQRVADQTVQLAKVTPHRVMRELYEQYIAYARAYSDAISNYTPDDDHLARVLTSTGSVITYACSAITYGSAQARAPLVSPPAPPSEIAKLTDPSDPQRFMTSADPKCPEWNQVLNQFAADVKPWEAIDSAIPASDWTAEQRAVIDVTIPVMENYADRIEELGRTSASPLIQDFAIFAAQYRRAYAAALPTYTPADGYLEPTALRSTSIIYEACQAAEG